ncbi:MAG: sterol desaturase family protein [Thermodesulfobacteriota bacterium]|nr:MAG: sterol desaturase family protein [Thermodesulfobacteriota bacterium]
MTPFHDKESVRLFLFLGGLVFFLVAELSIPYRPITVSKSRRWVHNLGITFFNSLVLKLCFASLIFASLEYVQKNNIGLLATLSSPRWVKFVATLFVFDFILYLWHRVNHEMPFFWRFHRVHHTDLNMDVSTATRFHIGELTFSAILKIVLIFLLGPTGLGLVIFESTIVLCAQFHHSSVKVPAWFEKLFWILFVPPSMHRIHHSVIIKQRNTNYGTIFSLWDRMGKTFLRDVDQEKIRIGIGAYPHASALTFFALFRMPFTKAVK